MKLKANFLVNEDDNVRCRYDLYDNIETSFPLSLFHTSRPQPSRVLFHKNEPAVSRQHEIWLKQLKSKMCQIAYL